jgi:hypothetical protein
MDARAQKLRVYFGRGSIEDAEALVEAGFGTPRMLREASDEAILAVPGIGPSKLSAIRERLG